MATKPADHKKKHHPKSAKFVFETDDARIEVPYIENLPAHAVMNLSGTYDSQADAAKAMVELLFSDQLEEWEKLTLGEFMEFQEKWNTESALELGEF